MDITFGAPWVLLLLGAIPLLYILYRRHSVAWSPPVRFSSLDIVKKAAGGGLRRHLPFVLLVSAIGTGTVGLADPLFPSGQAEGGAGIVLVLDGSGSMAADDYAPTRLDAAKAAAAQLVGRLAPGDRVGVILFGSSAITISYLTSDRAEAAGRIGEIVQGDGATALGDGLALGVEMAAAGPEKSTIILLSDGVHNSGRTVPGEALELAIQGNIRVHTIGMGSDEPVRVGDDIFGEPRYAELDEDTLREIADRTGGMYYTSVDNPTLDGIFEALSEDIAGTEGHLSASRWFLAGTVSVLLALAFVTYGRFKLG
ncbi:conserved hypothetical protein [Cenarchaeum symbiosum A]|uniref:VWFA domain-containing protein n=1 Tax=Cenarchaeum symbiosum (strain A) TaxID=414004 RepID=A0RZA9_CENSY|nr:conserved hypothetical protein [Cenarchaeum symbiosum A]